MIFLSNFFIRFQNSSNINFNENGESLIKSIYLNKNSLLSLKYELENYSLWESYFQRYNIYWLKNMNKIDKEVLSTNNVQNFISSIKTNQDLYFDQLSKIKRNQDEKFEEKIKLMDLMINVSNKIEEKFLSKSSIEFNESSSYVIVQNK